MGLTVSDFLNVQRALAPFVSQPNTASTSEVLENADAAVLRHGRRVASSSLVRLRFGDDGHQLAYLFRFQFQAADFAQAILAVEYFDAPTRMRLNPLSTKEPPLVIGLLQHLNSSEKLEVRPFILIGALLANSSSVETEQNDYVATQMPRKHNSAYRIAWLLANLEQLSREERSQISRQSINSLGLSSATQQSLEDAKILSIGELAKNERFHLERLGISQEGISEIETALKGLGLNFGVGPKTAWV